MAVTITTAQVRDAVRAGSSDAETVQIDRLRQVASIVVEKFAPSAPEELQNTAVAAMVGYAYDAPNSFRFTGYADWFRNSPAQTLLRDYHVVAASIVGEPAD